MKLSILTGTVAHIAFVDLALRDFLRFVMIIVSVFFFMLMLISASGLTRKIIFHKHIFQSRIYPDRRPLWECVIDFAAREAFLVNEKVHTTITLTYKDKDVFEQNANKTHIIKIEDGWCIHQNGRLSTFKRHILRKQPSFQRQEIMLSKVSDELRAEEDVIFSNPGEKSYSFQFPMESGENKGLISISSADVGTALQLNRRVLILTYLTVALAALAVLLALE
jgi:hypothetical protein